MTGPSYERALADAGVTLEELTRLYNDSETARRTYQTSSKLSDYNSWRDALTRAQVTARNALPALLAGCREADDQRVRAEAAERDAANANEVLDVLQSSESKRLVEANARADRAEDAFVRQREQMDDMIARALRREVDIAEANARADKAVAEAEALRVERDEARVRIDEITLALESRGYAHQCNGKGVGQIVDELETAEAALAEAQRQAAEAERVAKEVTS